VSVPALFVFSRPMALDGRLEARQPRCG